MKLKLEGRSSECILLGLRWPTQLLSLIIYVDMSKITNGVNVSGTQYLYPEEPTRLLDINYDRLSEII